MNCQKFVEKFPWKKGFRKNATNQNFIAHAHSEISEIYECFRNYKQGNYVYTDRNGKLQGAGYEIADAIISLLNLADYNEIDIEKNVE